MLIKQSKQLLFLTIYKYYGYTHLKIVCMSYCSYKSPSKLDIDIVGVPNLEPLHVVGLEFSFVVQKIANKTSA